jgi:hypothetical protein
LQAIAVLGLPVKNLFGRVGSDVVHGAQFQIWFRLRRVTARARFHGRELGEKMVPVRVYWPPSEFLTLLLRVQSDPSYMRIRGNHPLLEVLGFVDHHRLETEG